jgi:hypothetical protein
MSDERLGMAMGSLLRDIHPPAPDHGEGIAHVMAEIRLVPQDVRRAFPFGRTLRIGGAATGATTTPTEWVEPATKRILAGFGTLVIGVTVVLLGAFVLSGVLTLDRGSFPGAASSSSPGVAWSTDRVRLTADRIGLVVNDLAFGSDLRPTSVRSDPGFTDYWTLEVKWDEQDVHQRLFMYFRSDGTDWWVDEIRTRDGYDPAEWVVADGPFFTTPLGEAFEGDVTVDLLGQGRAGDPDLRVPAVLSFDSLRLEVSPGTKPPPRIIKRDRSSREALRMERALSAAIGDPHKGADCLTVEKARGVAADVLAELEVTGWVIEVADLVRLDGCAVAGVDEASRAVTIDTGLPPDVVELLEEFREFSLERCLDAQSAISMLTERLKAIGHEDFVVETSGGRHDRLLPA